MKFFKECGGSCYRPTVAPPPPPPPEEPVTTQTQVPLSNRKKLTSSKSRSVAHWRPALSVISEDVVVVPHILESKSEKRSSSTKRISMTKSRSFSYSDEYSSRKSSVPMIIPAFSPTPFMF